MINIVVILAAIIYAIDGQGGGMAELKSITGDEPYNGVGNAPAPIPRPMGFWGRPRYSPVSYGPYGARSYFGDYPYYGGNGYGRYTSYSYSPYGAYGLHPFDNLLMRIILGQPLLDPASRRSSIYNRPYFNALSGRGASFNSPISETANSRTANPERSNSFSVPQLNNPPSSGSVSLSSAVGGGFYKGKGNEMINKN